MSVKQNVVATSVKLSNYCVLITEISLSQLTDLRGYSQCVLWRHYSWSAAWNTAGVIICPHSSIDLVMDRVQIHFSFIVTFGHYRGAYADSIHNFLVLVQSRLLWKPKKNIKAISPRESSQSAFQGCIQDLDKHLRRIVVRIQWKGFSH